MQSICFFRLGAWPLLVPDAKDVFGGAEVRAFTFASALAQRASCEVHFAVAEQSALPQVTPEGIRVHGVPRRRGMWERLQGSCRKRFGQAPQPYPHLGRLPGDVVACFGVHDPTLSVLLAARRAGRRTLLFLTSSEDVCPQPAVCAKTRRHRRHHDLALQTADRIIVQTEFQQDALKRRYGREGALIRNPIDLSPAYDRTSNPNGVLWVGRADCDSKRADLCLLVARECPHIPFTVVMNRIDDTTYASLMQQVPENVQILTHVPWQEIDQLFASSAFLVNTSVSEGFPNTFLQAAKYGVPILSLNVDPDGMLVEHGCGRRTDGVPQLVHALHELTPTAAGYQAMSQAATRYVARYHDLVGRCEELECVLQDWGTGSFAA